jgi:hypothetical protein
VPAAALTVAPRHLRRFAIGNKSHSAAEASALNLIAHVFILPREAHAPDLRPPTGKARQEHRRWTVTPRKPATDRRTATGWTISRSFGPSGAGSVDLGDGACWLRQRRPREVSRSGRGALESAFRCGSARKRFSRAYRTDARQVNLGSLCTASRSWTFASSQSRSISSRLAPSGVWPPSAKRISI